jgi:hypothetical protein
MHAVKAHVKNGRLTVDEPTDLPEGEVVELVPLDEVLTDGSDYLDDEERAALHESLRESVEQMNGGQAIDIEDALADFVRTSENPDDTACARRSEARQDLVATQPAGCPGTVRTGVPSRGCDAQDNANHGCSIPGRSRLSGTPRDPAEDCLSRVLWHEGR